jgi:hypothetical protein
MAKFNIYTVSSEEAEAINALNSTRSNVLLVVCSFEQYVGVDPEALQSPQFSDYLQVLGGVFDPARVVEVEVVVPGSEDRPDED